MRLGEVKHKTSTMCVGHSIQDRNGFVLLGFFSHWDIWMTAWSVYEWVDPNYCPSYQQANLPLYQLKSISISVAKKTYQDSYEPSLLT